MVLPNFLICGGQKCGTTTLQEHAAQHPDIFIPEEGTAGREIHFFRENWEKGIKWYEQFFEGWKGEKAIGEKTPGYMFYPEVAERIKRVLPNVKLIFILRDPVDRAYSHYWMERIRGAEKRGFEKAAFAENSSYLDRGKYVLQLKRFNKYFKNNQMLILILKDLKENPIRVYKKFFDFLGVDASFVPSNLYRIYMKGGIYRSDLLGKCRNKIEETNFPKQICSLIDIINVKGLLPDKLFGRGKKSYPPLSTNMREKLIDYFRPFNNELANMYPHLNIAHWYD